MPKVRRAAREYKPAELEAALQQQWAKDKTHAKVRAARAKGKPFYFIDGPPYTSGHIHLGTAWNKVLKDTMLRYQRMQGRNVRDQAGYDMHGLPIEVKVEQAEGIKNKREIEALGVDKFVAKCRDFSTSFLDVMTKEFQQLGIWLDWDHPYMTIRNSYIEGAWGSFKAAHDRGLVYQAQRSIAWCWRCATALAAAELEYAEREDPSLYVKFPLVGKPGEHLVIWTTTPWTLPGNVAIAAHPDLGYAKVMATRPGQAGGKGDTLWVVDSQVESVVQAGGYTEHYVLETRSGRELEGWEYLHVFAEEVPFHRRSDGKRNRVILGAHVTADKTGLVHTATGHGAEDFEVGQKYRIDPFCPVDEAGVYTDEAGVFEGRFVKDAEADIIARLREKGFLLQAGTERHSYAHCWRCKSPILYRATPQWFIAVTKVQPKMLEEVERVKWVPEWAGSARQKDWVAQARDWCVSRQRYWGIPIPLWQCAEGHTAVVGSAAQLRKESTNYDAVLKRYKKSPRKSALEQRLKSLPDKDIDFHRPWIDEVALRCRACQGEMRRVPDVFDVWYDSACASWAQLGWPGDKKQFQQWFPCDWIVEGLDQTRGWFYSQLAAGVAAFGKVPYEAVLMHGFVHDEQGRPMSKSLGNIIPPAQVIEKHGADAFRLYILSTCAPWEDVHFNWEGVRNSQRALNILWNVHVFATQALDGVDPARLQVPRKALRAEDRWLLSRVGTLGVEVSAAFQAQETHKAARLLQGFILDDLSRWYVRLVRDRLNADEDTPDKRAAQKTLHHVLRTTAVLLAPIAPHITEAMHRDLGGKTATVHLERWPKPGPGERQPKLEQQMAVARSIVEASMAARDKAQVKLRMPVPAVTIAGGKEVQAAVKALGPLVAELVNAKRIDFAGQQWEGLVWQVQPDRTRIGPVFKGHAPKVMEALKAVPAQHLREAFDAGKAYAVNVEGQEHEVRADMVRFAAAMPEGVVGAEFPGGSVYLDTHTTPELQAEGLAREVVRRIQETRKEAGFERKQQVRTELGLAPASAELLKPHLERIAAATRSKTLRLSDKPQGKHVKEWDVEGETVVVGLA